jgi:pimeloyl-ACP methyl ester carboxylesterase
MTLEFLTILSSDNLMLPGLFFTPAKKSKRAAVWLHGMGDSGSFYNPRRANAIAKALTSKGIAFLSFNNRGAHNSKRLMSADKTLPEKERSYKGGTHFELIRDAIKDIDGAAALLHERGYDELYLIGHSSGANKICVYDAHKKNNPFSKYVLAGAGDDTGLFYLELGKHRFDKAMAYAKAKISAGEGLRIMPKYTGMHPFSAQSALDILDPEGDYSTFPYYELKSERLGKKKLFKEYAGIGKPLLAIYGELDEFCEHVGGAAAALEILKQYTNPKTRAEYALITGADHGFHQQETVFAEKVAGWLA